MVNKQSRGRAKARSASRQESESNKAPSASESTSGRDVYLDAPPGEDTRAVMNLGGVVARERKRRIGLVLAAVVVVVVGAVLSLDHAGLIEIPGMGAMYDFTGVEDPNQERAAARVEPHASAPTLSDAERKRLRDELLGRGGSPAAPKTRAPPQQLSAGDRELTASLFADARKAERKVILAPPKEIHAPNLPSGLTREAIYEVVSKNSSAMSLCMARSMKAGESLRGKMEVEISIASSGHVEDAYIGTSGFATSALGECTLRAVRRWRFPTFTGEPVLVSFPYVLSAGP